MTGAPTILTTSTWAAALAAAEPWQPVGTRVLVIAPHPDDESVLFGALIAAVMRRGASVRVVAVTDGEAAYPSWADPGRLAALRRREQRDALRDLGADPGDVIRFGLPDGGVAAHEDRLVDLVTRELSRGVDLVVAPWEHDHHSDHEACGRAATRAITRVGRHITCASGLFWALLRDDPPPHVHLRAVEVGQETARRKQRAIARHASQVRAIVHDPPVLGPAELAVTRLPAEHYLLR